MGPVDAHRWCGWSMWDEWGNKDYMVALLGHRDTTLS